MPTKKKSKPSFQVPEELQKAPQSGWVYRSDEQAPAREAKAGSKTAATSRGSAKSKPASSAPSSHVTAVRHATHAPSPAEATPRAKAPATASSTDSSESTGGFLDLTAKALSAGIGTAGNLVLLTTRIIAVPVSLGRRLFGL